MPDFNFQYVRYKTIPGEREGPHVLLLAGVHGDEYEPIAAATQLIGKVPDILGRGKITIVPIVNFPAFKKASRCGEDGLDLARICPGNKQGTPSEVIAAEVSELISESDYLIDLHTGGNNYEIAPFCGYVLHPSDEVSDKQHQMAHAFNLKSIWGTSSNLDGRTLSIARDYNIPAVYAEFGGGGGSKDEVVKEYVQGCLNVLISLGMAEGELADGRCEYVVKDYRDESGHLQRMLPASSDGFFKAEVSLGDFVKKGQLFGTITDPNDLSVSTVFTDQDGMVFLLRAVPSVREEDSLGGILPITKSGEVTIS